MECPRCGSTEDFIIEPRGYNWWIGAWGVLLLFPFFMGFIGHNKEMFKCPKCGYKNKLIKVQNINNKKEKKNG